MAMDGEDYVVNGWLQWRSLIFDTTASVVLAWMFFVSDWIGFVIGALATAVRSLGSWLGELVFRTVTLPSNGMQAAWETAAEFIGSFGLVGWIVGVILVLVTLQLAVSTIMNYGWS